MKNRSLKKAVAAALAVTMSLSLYTAPVFAEETGSTEEVTMETSLEEANDAGEAANTEEAMTETTLEMETENATLAAEDVGTAETELEGSEVAEGQAPSWWEDGWRQTDANGNLIYKYDSQTKTLTIKSITGEPTAMKDYDRFMDTPCWRELKDKIDKVVIENSVTSIGANAFDNYGIKTVEMSDSITKIGDHAFYQCNQLQTIKMSENLQSIGNNAFMQCSSLQEINIPAKVQSIGDEAFWCCSSLKTVSFHKGLKIIGESAFHGTAVETVSLPEGLEKIGDRAFDYCQSLKSVSIASGEIGNSTFAGQPNTYGLETLMLGSGVTKIGKYAFSNTKIKSLTIPGNIKEIETYAFQWCNQLEDLVLENGIGKIEDKAFDCCSKLNNVSIDMTSVKARLFQFVDGAKVHVTLGQHVKEVAVGAFGGYGKVEKLSIDEANPYLSERDGMIYDKGQTTLQSAVVGSEKIVLPSTLKKISSNALSGCNYVSEIKFTGDAPEFAEDAFVTYKNPYTNEIYRIRATAYYPKNNPTWTADKLQDYGGKITWIAGDPATSGGSTGGRTVPFYSLSENGGNWDGNKYYLPDGTLVTDAFFFDGNYTYYLQADGTPMKDRLTYHPDGEHIIYLDENGHEAFTNFVYCPSVGYICYFDSNGYLYKDQITFVGDKTYYLNGNGALEQNGWFQFANGLDYGFANSDGTLVTTGFSYDPYGRVVFYHWNGMVARGLISDGVYYYSMDETDGHYLGQFPVQ